MSQGAEIEVLTPQPSTTIYAGRVNQIQFLVKNNQAIEDVFYFSIWPSYWAGLDKYWTPIQPGEVKNISMIFSPPRDEEEGAHVFTVSVQSINSNISVSKTFSLNVERITDVFISEIKLNKQILSPGETLVIQPIFTSLEKTTPTQVFVYTEILRDGMSIQTFEDTLTVKPMSTETLVHTFDITPTDIYGTYQVSVYEKDNLNNILDQKTVEFEISRVDEISKEKFILNNIFFTTTFITVKNNGNIPSCTFYVTESLPLVSKHFFYPEREPALVFERDNRIVYSWLITDLNPGESVTITYQLRFTNVLIATIIIIVSCVFVFWFFFRPKLMKKYSGLLDKDKEIKISLSIKNKSRKPLKNVIVKDFVPSLVKVLKDFDTLVPEIKKKDIGTELIWKIKEIKPKEERILTYKIKPVIEVLGELKLPKAHFTFETKKGKRERIASKTMIIRGKVK